MTTLKIANDQTIKLKSVRRSMMMNLYDNKPHVRWGIIAFATLIGIISIIYTNYIVKQLIEREKTQIDLFAKVQAFVATAEHNENMTFLITEILDANNSIPVILADEQGNPIAHRNVDLPSDPKQEDAYLRAEIEEMKLAHEPILIQLDVDWKNYIYYKNSFLVTQLTYFPYVQLTVIMIFFLLVYFIFTASRRAEQNRVWVGLAKETAHQLGTPLSSLMAWIEYFRADDGFDQEVVGELEKDIKRLEMITSRFSNIGSVPALKPENTFQIVSDITAYLQKRISTKVKISISTNPEADLTAHLNRPLFEWVIENICKNAVDAMSGAGRIDIFISTTKDDKILLDISDTGKGIPPSQLKTVFEPGFTTKKRGWGLGLTLVKRIVENYHRGKIFVLKSEVEVGTTFRILLPK